MKLIMNFVKALLASIKVIPKTKKKSGSLKDSEKMIVNT